MGQTIWKQLADPLYDNGSNDKGILIQLGHSLGRVALGFLLACLVAVPLGFVIGMSPLLRRAFDHRRFPHPAHHARRQRLIFYILFLLFFRRATHEPQRHH